MKNIIILTSMLVLTGCSTIDTVKKYWPRDHDSALVSKYVDLEVQLTKVNCETKEGFKQALEDADWLNRYSEFRNDPQKDTTKAIIDNLQKASTGSDTACKRWVNLTNINMKVIKKSWEGR